jgi:hypothetical protein
MQCKVSFDRTFRPISIDNVLCCRYLLTFTFRSLHFVQERSCRELDLFDLFSEPGGADCGAEGPKPPHDEVIVVDGTRQGGKDAARSCQIDGRRRSR